MTTTTHRGTCHPRPESCTAAAADPDTAGSHRKTICRTSAAPPHFLSGRRARTSTRIMFFDLRTAATRAMAKRICRRCTIRSTCLNIALTSEQSGDDFGRHGIYGGTTPEERGTLWEAADE